METEFIAGASPEDAGNLRPWAAVCIEVDGGIMCFESYDDYDTWSNQD